MKRASLKRPRRLSGWAGTVLAVVVAGLAGCKPSSRDELAPSLPVHGAPIVLSNAFNPSVLSSNVPFVPADYTKPDAVEGGFILLGWDKLSGFKFDVEEFYPEGHSGRPLLRSSDVIPAPMKAYDGKRVRLTGFVLPLRTRKGQVTEFLLLRDQGTCCFGARAQINHFIRVKDARGIQPGAAVPWQVSGTLRVGEIHVQGYLTGIYELEAESAREAGR